MHDAAHRGVQARGRDRLGALRPRPLQVDDLQRRAAEPGRREPVGEVGGDRDTDGAAERQPHVRGAHDPQGGRDVGEPGHQEHHDQDQPVGVLQRRPGPAEVSDLGQQEMQGEAGGGHDDDGLEPDAQHPFRAQVGDVGGLGERRPQVAEQPVRRPDLLAGRGAQRERGQQRHGALEPLGRDDPDRRLHGPLRPDLAGEPGQQLGDVLGALPVRGGGRADGEVDEPGQPADGEDVGQVQAPVRDARLVHPGDLGPDVGEQRGVELRRRCPIKSYPRDLLFDECRPRADGDHGDDAGDVHARALGEQADVGLVLDLLAGCGQRSLVGDLTEGEVARERPRGRRPAAARGSGS